MRQPDNVKGRPQAGPALNTDSTAKSFSSIDALVTLADAERLTTRIQLRLGTIADNVESVLSLIEQAMADDVHQVLGYRSWTAYVAEKFGGLLARIGKAERLPLVELLSGQGMSTRAIAAVVGTSHQTVANDLTTSGVKNLTPAEPIAAVDPAGFFTDEAEMRDAFTMADTTPDEFESAITEARADDDLSRENVVAKIIPTTERIATGNVVGIDGKTYTRPAPAVPHRRALPDQARDAGWELNKAAARIQRILADDRLADNRDRVGEVLGGHLRHVQTIFRDALDLLPGETQGLTDPYELAVDALGHAVERFERVNRENLAATRYLKAEPVPRQHLEQLRTALQQVADDLGEWWSQ